MKQLVFGGLFFVALAPLRAQQQVFDSLVKAHSYTLVFTPEGISGKGADFLLSATRNAQFVLLGEEHNNREIPTFTMLLFRLLQQRYHFQYLALEQDPVMMQLVHRIPRPSLEDSIRQLARRYPYGFTFNSDQELALLAGVARTSRGRADPVWGCDQVFGVGHVLDELARYWTATPLPPHFLQLREAASKGEAVRDLSERHFIAKARHLSEFQDLWQQFQPVRNPRAAFLIQALQLSDSIFGSYYKGAAGDPQGAYDNTQVREEYMKDRFMAEYNRARTADKELPKVLLKFGQWHLMRGFSPANIPSLGNFVVDLARSIEKDAFSIWMQPFDAPEGAYDLSKIKKLDYLKPFTDLAGVGQWTLMDLRPLRAYYNAGKFNSLTAVTADFKRLIFGFDALLLMGGSQPATYGWQHRQGDEN